MRILVALLLLSACGRGITDGERALMGEVMGASFIASDVRMVEAGFIGMRTRTYPARAGNLSRKDRTAAQRSDNPDTHRRGRRLDARVNQSGLDVNELRGWLPRQNQPRRRNVFRPRNDAYLAMAKPRSYRLFPISRPGGA